MTNATVWLRHPVGITVGMATFDLERAPEHRDGLGKIKDGPSERRGGQLLRYASYRVDRLIFTVGPDFERAALIVFTLNRVFSHWSMRWMAEPSGREPFGRLETDALLNGTVSARQAYGVPEIRNSGHFSNALSCGNSEFSDKF